jgi:MHS family proline/betaine transporter-like MFS transporter
LPIKTFLDTNLKKWLVGSAAFLPSSIWAYAITVFGFSYVVNHQMISRAELTVLHLYIVPIMLGVLIFWAWLGDKVPRIKIFHFNAVASIVLAYPVFYWLSQGEVILPFLAFGLLSCPTLANAPGFFSEIYPSNVRQTGCGLTYTFGTFVGSGLLMMIVQKIMSITNDIMSVAPVFVAVGVIALIASVYLEKSKNLINLD